jgi:hypothetical protein
MNMDPIQNTNRPISQFFRNKIIVPLNDLRQKIKTACTRVFNKLAEAFSSIRPSRFKIQKQSEEQKKSETQIKIDKRSSQELKTGTNKETSHRRNSTYSEPEIQLKLKTKEERKTVQEKQNSDGILKFPSKSEIMTYLQEHDLTNDSYLSGKNILDSIADHFANLKLLPTEIESNVALKMNEINTTLNLPELTTNIIIMNLIDALTDCASQF